MNKLIIKTRYHVTVELLLMHFQMIEKHHHIEVMYGGIEVDHPDDGMSQDLVFWLAMAEGCGLIESYLFARKFSPRDEKEQEVIQEILNTAQRGLSMAQNGLEARATWRASDLREVLKDALEDIVKICQEQMKEG